jgi:hypothetical protein
MKKENNDIERRLELIREIASPIYPLNGKIVSDSQYEKYLIHKMAELFHKQNIPIPNDEIEFLTIKGNTSLYLADLKKMMRIIDANETSTLTDISSRLQTIEALDDEFLASFANRLAKHLGFEYVTVNSCSVPDRRKLPFEFMREKRFACANKYYMLPKNNSRTGIIMIVRRHKDYLDSIPKKCLDYYVMINNRCGGNFPIKNLPLQIHDMRALEEVIDDGKNYLNYVKRILHSPFIEPMPPPEKEPRYMNSIDGHRFIDYNRCPKENLKSADGKSYKSTHLFVKHKMTGRCFEIKITYASAYFENCTNPEFGHKAFRDKQKDDIFEALKKR